MERSSRKKLYGILGSAAVAVLLLVLFLGLWQPGAQESGYSDEKDRTIPSLNFSILERDSFNSMKTWSVLPLAPGELGNDNPFNP